MGSLRALTKVSLRGIRIGAEEARALGRLTNLTSLYVGGNEIGEEGARALGALTNLTRPALLVIRGISDDASPRKAELDSTGDGALRRHAMHNAIDLLLALIDGGLLP